MIEFILVDYLGSVLPYKVILEVPKQDIPAEYVLIERTGGSETNFLKDATVAIQTCAKKLLRAAEMAEEVRDAMEAITSLQEVTSVEVNSIYNFTDQQTKGYRYQSVYNVTYY